MKNRVNKTLLFASLLVIVTLSSCNRGYGCPGSFSADDFFSSLFQSLSQLL